MNAHAKIAALLKQTMGLDVVTVGATALDYAVRSRMTACGVLDADNYWARLKSSAAELQELIEAVVVPETWFFRDREVHAALGRIAAREWLPTRRAGPLRALSVPCSSGEEPYSIAMTLLGAGLDARDFEVQGVDISKRALAGARRAVYRDNSFRGADLAFRDQYFRIGPEGYELDAAVRACVRFQQGNVVSPDLLAHAAPFDVVFCRNVLIYFDAPTQQRVLRTLERLLAPEGVLFVGPAEAFLARGSALVAVNHARAFAFKKGCAPAAEPRRKVARSPSVQVSKPVPVVRRKAALQTIHSAPAAAPAKVTGNLEAIKRLADGGRLAEAARACESYLREHDASAAAYYLLGLVLDAMGDELQAATCYRKAVFLEHDHAEALLHLALFAERHGDLPAARRLKMRAQRVKEVTDR